MRIWRVKVRSQHATKTKRGHRTCVDFCLVEAEDSSQALERGHEFIEGQAPSDVRWLSFEAVEAATVQLPMHI